ncbi:hypothetical protein VKT23_007539 [Stygiomarasmius scandens]|uniref:DUF6535 domain-containing protein n=1 Tax=Marasmiellus scandens TaxID=2682957 RepID=A0ABR1JK60_9AGAR
MSGALQKGVRGALQVVRPRSVISHPEIGEDRSKDKTKESAPDRFNADEDACSKLWAVYVGEAEKYDGELVSGWKDDMSDLVVFSSLYSAVLTAFIIESYQTLQQDPADLTVDLLTQIAMQLVAASNGTAVTFQPPDEFQPDPSSVACNLLWFLALALALTCSLLAIFVQQWTRDFKHKTSLRPSPVLRAKIFMFSYFGMRKFGMHAVIDLIPFLLHLSLILFFIGLVEFLAPVNGAVKYLMACFLGVFGLVYLLFTFLPIIRLDAPFRTPLSNIFWSSGNAFGRWLQRLHGLRVDENFNLTESALEKSYNDDADGHDQKAMTFTIKSLTDDSELLPFIEALPDAINGSGVFRHSNVSLLAPSIMSSNPSLNIIAHITAFTDNPSAWLDEKLGIRCLTAYPQAVWSLAQTFTESIPIAAFDLTKVWFPEAIANKLLDIESITEAAQNHSATSALALVRSTQIRSLQSRFALIESKLSDLSLERGDDRDVMMDLCRDVTSFDWNEKILDTFSRFHASLQSRATGDSYKNVLKELDSREWANAQIYALGEFLTHSIGIKNHYMLFETYNYLSQAVADSLKNVELFVWDDNLAGSLCKPIQQIANLQYQDSLSDQLFILTLRHFHWDK